MRELASDQSQWRSQVRVCFPGSRTTCDWMLGDPLEWAIEIKMARPNGDNGKPDDTAIKDILSPFRADRSALTDCLKLAESPIEVRRAILIYGFDDTRRPAGGDHWRVRDPCTITCESRTETRRSVRPAGPSGPPSGEVSAWEINA